MLATVDTLRQADPDALVASGLGPDVLIDPGAALEAAPPQVSLLSTAVDITQILTDAYGPHWINGIQLEPEAGALTLATDFPYFWACPSGAAANPGRLWTANSPGGIKNIPTKPANIEYIPYTAHTADPCISTFGMFGRDAHGRARRLLNANLARIMENELWTGARATMAGWPNDFFRNTPTALNGGAATGIVSALAELEQGIFDLANRPGFIHCQPRLAQLWLWNDLIEATPSGRQLVTALGTKIVPGTGYDGSGTGLAAGTHSQSWAYGTGPVVVARTPIRDQDTNEADIVAIRSAGQPRNVRAEAEVAAFWDSKVRVGVLVNHLVELS